LLDLHDGIAEGEKILLDPVGYWGPGGINPLGIHKPTDFIDDVFPRARQTVEESIACQHQTLFEGLVDLALDQLGDHQQRVFNIESRRVTPSRFREKPESPKDPRRPQRRRADVVVLELFGGIARGNLFERRGSQSEYQAIYLRFGYHNSQV
jgi:hypothetical protein